MITNTMAENFGNMTDENVAIYVREKDPEAFLEIVTRYQKKLLRYARALVRDEAKAADIVQDSFIKAFVNLNGFDAKKKFSTWIYRIVHNEAVNAVIKYRKEVPLPDGFDIGGGEDPEAEVEAKELREALEQCLSDMPILYSEPLALRYLEEKSYEEISDILRVPIGTVSARINRGKALMRKLCKKI